MHTRAEDNQTPERTGVVHVGRSTSSGPSVDSNRSLIEHDLIELFLQRYDRERTRRAYRQDLDDFFAWFTGTPVDGFQGRVTLELARRISFVEVNRYLSALEQRGLAASTRRRKLSCLRSFFSLLVSLRAMDVNPAAREVVRRIPQARSGDAPIVVLTKQQARRLVDAAMGRYPREAAEDEPPQTAYRDCALILTMIHGCLRRSEAAAMDVEHIRQVGVHWVLELPRTKGGDNQWVKLHSRAVDAIEAMKQHYGITSGALFRSFSPRNFGERLKPDGIYRIVRKLARRAGLEQQIGAHTLRHTGCTLAIEGGASLKQVQEHARHKDLSTTMRYVHQRDRLRDSAADHISF